MALRAAGRWARLGSALRGRSSGPRDAGDSPQHRDLREALRKSYLPNELVPWHTAPRYLPLHYNCINEKSVSRNTEDKARPCEGSDLEDFKSPASFVVDCEIIDKEINPFVDKWEEEGQFPAHKVFKILGQAGFLGVDKPTEYGGMGLDFSYNIAVAEELGNIRCGGIPMAVGVQTGMATPALTRFGSHELKKQFLLPTIAGDFVACLGVSEAGAGSDVANIKTTAVRKGDEYVINGGKMWITSGSQADWMCLLANTSEGPPHQNKSLICLPMNLPGIHVAKKIDKLGMRSSDTAQIFFEDVRVPCKNLIGEEGKGFTYQMLQFQEERLLGVALVLAPMETVIQETIDYTRERKVFGQPVLHNQTVHFRLAELATEVELLRSLLHRAVALYVEGNDVTKLASMAKLKAGRLTREVTDSCLQFWGGMGFTNEVLVSRLYRDLRLTSIGGGTDETMLSIICKYMEILPRK